ncbi:MAG: DUF421 domain-containing protein [Bacillus sp. (in: firmicutes)]
MDQLWTVGYRTVVMYILIVVIFRIMGKREIGELSLLDLVVYVMLAEIAVAAIEDPKSDILGAILPMFVLLLIQLTLAFSSLKSYKFRTLLDGKPVIIINQGKIDDKMMKRQKYNYNDLLMQLREQQVFDISAVEYAVLETSGKLSVLTKSTSSTFSHPLILDGEIQAEQLEEMNRSEQWLLQELYKQGYMNVNNISFCSYSQGKWYIDEKDD